MSVAIILTLQRPPRSTRTYALVPYTTLFRAPDAVQSAPAAGYPARVRRGPAHHRGARECAGADRAPRQRAPAGGLSGRRDLVRRAEVQERPPRAGAALAGRKSVV